MDQAELHALEERCIHDSPPPCTMACPAQVDVRGLMAAVAAGQLDEGRALLRKALPFPRAVALTCDQPCRPVCLRGQRGDALQVRDVERACMAAPEAAARAGFRPPPKPQKVAIVGGGLAGLTVGGELARKGYRVTLFERSARLGGSVWERLPENGITVEEREALEREIEGVAAVGVSVRRESPVEGADALLALLESFKAVVLTCGGTDPEGCLGALRPDAGSGQADVDLQTLATAVEGLFVGGSALRELWSPVASIADGRRLALSIERFLQRVSLSAGREQEGPPAQLAAMLEQIEPLAAVLPADAVGGYTAAEAAEEAARCLQCRCDACVHACTFLRSFDTYPGKAVREINNSLIITPGMGYRLSKKMIDSCAICGLCAEVCPTDIDMGEICQDARRTMWEKGYTPPAVHDFALRDQRAANSSAFALARHQPGCGESAWAFLPGCQLPGSHSHEVRAAYEHLTRTLEGGVGLLLACCGAPAEWAGRETEAAEAVESLRGAWRSLGEPRLIVACSSCARLLAGRAAELPLVSLWEVLDQVGVPRRELSVPPLALHDPCAARHAPAVQAAVRRLLERVAGGHVELPRSGVTTECCGYGGLQVIANAALARETVAQRIAQDPHDYVAYCAMCRDLFVGGGKPTWHLIELLFGDPDRIDPAKPGPRLTERHRARARLKRELVRDLWGEAGVPDQEEAAMRLLLDDALRDKLAELLISEDDLAAVITEAERTGERLEQTESGHFIAHARPEILTYWVEYSPVAGGAFHVHNAYSHRLEIIESKATDRAPLEREADEVTGGGVLDKREERS